MAEPRITGMPSICARLTATSRAWYRGVVSCLKLLSCSSSITRSPSRRAGQRPPSGTDDNLDLARGNALPVAMPLGVAHVAVQDGNPGKPAAEPADRLRREADLGHQHNRLAAARHHFLDRRQIDLGLAAAGDAMNQERREAARLRSPVRAARASPPARRSG